MSSIPQFVVVGAQSAGKSSVLRRISNNSIKLPESEKKCTLVPTILKLRRSLEDKMSVTLKGPFGFSQNINIEQKDADGVKDAILNAQNMAMEKCPSSSFAEVYSIEVIVNNPSMPNVTLIDLPGFTNASDESAQSVNRMVEM